MAVEIIENLYLGGADSVRYSEHYKAVVSLYSMDLSMFEPENIHRITIDDMPYENILKHFQPACTFIKQHIDKGKYM